MRQSITVRCATASYPCNPALLVLAGLKALNASIDLYAFGILMWQIVCGTRLYQGLTTKQIIRGVVRENLRPQFPVWVPAEYRWVRGAPGRGRRWEGAAAGLRAGA